MTNTYLQEKDILAYIFLSYLNRFEKLNNHFIEVEVELSEAPEEEVKFLNGKDKFEAMAEKNPKLITLKNLFKLDIDY